MGESSTEPTNCDDGDTTTTKKLCGYELTKDLDFDKDKDGKTFGEMSSGDCSVIEIIQILGQILLAAL